MSIKGTNKFFEAMISRGKSPATSSLLHFLDEIDVSYVRDEGEVSLKEDYEFLVPELLKEYLRKSGLTPPSLEVYRVATSTNDIVMGKLLRGSKKDCLCLAEAQTEGKGRRGRIWVSPFGRNVYMSYGFAFKPEISRLEGLSVGVGIEVAESLIEAGLTRVGLKWPNDLILDQKKLGGILVEMAPTKNDSTAVVVGLGINLRLSLSDAELIDQPHAVAGHGIEISRNRLIGGLALSVISAVKKCSEKGFVDYKSKWNRFNSHAGEFIRLKRADQSISGFDKGIDAKGNLVLDINGEKKVFNSGEVDSIRRKIAPD